MDDGILETEATTINYDYSGGLFDYETREFRGFQTVTQTNPNNTVQITNFYQGRDDSEALPGDNYYFKGRTARIEFKDSSGGSLLREMDFTWDTYPENPGNWTFVKLTHKQSDSYDGVTTTTEEDYEYDNENGSLKSVTTSGIGAGCRVHYQNLRLP